MTAFPRTAFPLQAKLLDLKGLNFISQVPREQTRVLFFAKAQRSFLHAAVLVYHAIRDHQSIQQLCKPFKASRALFFSGPKQASTSNLATPDTHSCDRIIWVAYQSVRVESQSGTSIYTARLETESK